jgi:hypothetical protein
MVRNVLLVLVIALIAAGCALTWSGQSQAYAKEQRGQRPDDVLNGVRDGYLVVGMN